MNEIETADTKNQFPDLEDRVLSDEEYEDLNTPTETAFEVTFSSQDFSVDSLVSRMKRGSMETPHFSPESGAESIPGFQRSFVWTKSQMDRFIESLLLGYPAPGLFLVREQENKKLLILDGQQRLSTLSYFYRGVYRDRIFRLENVDERFRGLTYESLDESQRNMLDDSYMSATIVNSDGTSASNDAIFSIFERLNSGGTPLTPHEIRVALYAGRLMDCLADLNREAPWRSLFGAASKRIRDHELILRIISLYEDHDGYVKPMKRFLNQYASSNRQDAPDTRVFMEAINKLNEEVGRRSFTRPGVSQVNFAQAESIVIGVMKNIDSETLTKSMGRAVDRLMDNPQFQQATGRSTGDTEAVKTRISTAIEAFRA